MTEGPVPQCVSRKDLLRGMEKTWSSQSLRQRAICLLRVRACVCVRDTLSRKKSVRSRLLQPPRFTEVCLPCENITKTCDAAASSRGKSAWFLHLGSPMSGKRLLESNALVISNNNRLVSVTSGVQTGGSLAAVQLPLLDFEVRTGPFQACVAPQFCEELLHGPLAGPTAAHRSSHFPHADAAAATSASVQGC